MKTSDLKTRIEGYWEIQQDIEVSRKYGIDYCAQKGIWMEAVQRLHPHRLQLRVNEIIEEHSHVSTLRLVAAGGSLPPFQAGQYINLFVEIDGVRTGRPYSISSSPTQTAFYDITVRQVPNGFVSDYLLNRIRVGDVLESTGPAGHFCHNPLFHGKDLVFLAGGSGITPFMSMIRETTDRGLDRRIHLIYGCRSPQDAIFHDELLTRAKHHGSFSYDLVISEPVSGYKGLTGLLDASLISKLLSGIENKTFYLCGPKDMYEFCIPELKKLGIPKRRIRHEVFGSPAAINLAPAWPQEVSPDTVFSVKLSNGKEIPALASEPLLISMERAGVLVQNCCRSGECSLCRVKLISGKVFQSSEALLRKSDRETNYVHSCVSYPLSDLEVMI